MKLAERITVKRWHPGDEETVAGCYAVNVAAHAVDDPVEPPPSAGVFPLYLEEGWEQTPGEVWYVPSDAVPGGDAAGSVAAFYRISFPDLENLDRAGIELKVHPALRRRGIGGALLKHAAERASAHDRTVLEAAMPAGSAGDEFAKELGATLELEEVRRIQYLSKVPPGRIAELRAEAERAAAGYSLLQWTGPVPDEYCGPVAEVFSAMADAPKGENVEAEVWDAARVRERTGSMLRAGLMRGYTIAAVHDASGEMAALTQVFADPAQPGWGWQGLTAVTRPHRGHRLGLLVKTAMLEWLASAEPQIERVETGNAAANAHMIAVNETLGYEVVEPGWRFYELPVAAVLGQAPMASA